MSTESKPKPRTTAWYLAVVFVLLILGIGVVGSLYDAGQRKETLLARQSELAAIADLKVRQIAAWRKERLGDAEVISRNAQVARAAQRWFEDPTDAALEAELLAWLEALRRSHSYRNVILVDGAGVARLDSPDAAEPIGSHAQALIADALRSHEASMSDFHRAETVSYIHLDLVAPLLVPQGSGIVAVGAVLLRIDPDEYLYPLIQSWPVPSASSETLLVRREGDDLLYLNDVRHQAGTALTLRLPIASADVPAALAVRGQEGFVQGNDYRGVPVLAALRAVPDSPWYLIAKVDAEEVYAPIRARTALIALLAGVLILGAGAGVGVFWHRESMQYYRRQYEAERERRSLARRYEFLSRNANDAIFLADAGMNLLEANERALEQYGYTRDELLTMNGFNLRPLELRVGLDEFFERLRREKAVLYETVHRRKDGSTFPVEINMRLVGVDGQETYLSIARDITERRRAQQALQLERDRLLGILHTMPEGVYIVNAQGDIEYVNPALEREFGPAAGRKCHEYFLGLGERCAWCNTSEVIAGNSVRREWHSEKTGKTYDLFDTPIQNADGTVSKLEIFHDVTDRKLAEEALRQANERLTAIVTASPLAIFILDPEGDVMKWNPAAERMFGWSEAEVLGQFVPIVPRDKEQEAADFRRRVLAGEWLVGIEARRRRKDGSAILVSLSAAPIRDAEGRVVAIMTMLADITDRKRLEAQFLQAQKMETVGRLAGGVAHDFNNLLTAIIGYATLARGALTPQHDARADIEQILKASDRAASLTRQLLAFSRRQVIAPTMLRLSELILDMDKMLRRLIGEHIELVTLAAPDAGTIEADAGQMEQVLVNLVVNARDAMPNGGKLVIETASVVLDEDYARSHMGVNAGPYVMLSVSDMGVGMTDEVKSHAFEPFYTTKEAGRGTGLGLATVYGIVKQHGGHISLYSEEGHGTTFKIYLPQLSGVAAERVRREKEDALPRGSERVLVVEDEPAVRTVSVRILKDLGYAVLEASNGHEALQIMADADQGFHLLMTDLVMPQMSGKVLAEQVRVDCPGIKVLFVSGYTEELSVQRDHPEQGTGFLQKPFMKAALARKVRELLDM